MVSAEKFSPDWLVDGTTVDAAATISRPASAIKPSASKKPKTSATATRKMTRSAAHEAEEEVAGPSDPPPPSSMKKSILGRLSALKKSSPQVTSYEDAEAGPDMVYDHQYTPPHQSSEYGGAFENQLSPPPPSRVSHRKRRSSGSSLPVTPTLQSALKKGMIPRTPSMKRVSFMGYTSAAVTVVPRWESDQ
jgi:hypothetical protein